MKTSIWVNWEAKDVCISKEEIRDKYCFHSDFERFLKDYVTDWGWREVWERFNIDSERETILQEYKVYDDERFEVFVSNYFEEIEIQV